jgi:hypothetical protein
MQYTRSVLLYSNTLRVWCVAPIAMAIVQSLPHLQVQMYGSAVASATSTYGGGTLPVLQDKKQMPKRHSHLLFIATLREGLLPGLQVQTSGVALGNSSPPLVN